MAKQLKIWNGRSHGHKYKRHHVYVAAYSMKQAAELVSIACFGEEHPYIVSVSEIAVYYSKGVWGDRMKGIEATEPCVYLCDERIHKNKPFKVI
jgi:hypothetical protein